eukprot:Plantae.Rhodophyta-Rhodochaete_pulchella.ctg30721.p1 GENE.Plantae.Rhodophyta-Rhodochaete_pulchella.ctg30721~~Plantae.Rhodophyta-Rhodochaete_pulchella.ctg30721.p1  ORF type:complete len:230 (+),score=29.87 Plantae.Rhodophyta-Rhodochaete_pulchella.ctg30721:221-910(+)
MKVEVAGTFPPVLPFGEEICSLRVMYRELWDWMDRRWANPQQQTSRRFLMTLAKDVYTETENREGAVGLAHHAIESGPRTLASGPETRATIGSSSLPSSCQEGTAAGSDHTSHNAVMRFKDKASKFSGELGQSWAEYASEYQQVPQDYELNQRQRIQLLHSLLAGNAKRFYLDRADCYASTYWQAVDMLEGEDDSIGQQNRAKNHFNSLRITRLVEDDGLEDSTALEKA